MSTIASRTFTEAFDDVRNLLNDAGGDVYTDTVLLPLGAQIHGEIQDKFAQNDRQFGEIIDNTNFSYTEAAETIAIPGPVDLMYEPIDIWARTSASEDWYLLNRVWRLEPPPADGPLGSLTDWEWSDSTIRVIPCSLNQEIRVRYMIQMDYPTASSVMGAEGFYYALVYGTAFLGATRTKRTIEASIYKEEYGERLEDALLRSGRIMQGMPMRMGGYRPARPQRTVVLTTH